MINDYLHLYSMLPAPLLSHCCLRSQNPDYYSGDTKDPPHSVLLTFEPMKRGGQGRATRTPPQHPPPFTLSHCAEYKYPVQLEKS